MRPYVLAENNWKNLKDSSFDLAILPWGATEAHNYHMPYGTDNYEADAISHEAARLAWEQGANIIVLPTIPFGVNTGQADIFLDINLNPSTQYAILSDILEVLERQGIRKLLVFNSHGGNDFKTALRELGLNFPDMLLCQSSWFKSLDKTQYFEEMGDHADEMETSLMMYLKPELVLPLSEAGDGTERKHKLKEFSEGWAWAERRWSQISADTGVGNPQKSSADKGKAYFEAVTQKIGDFFVRLSQLDIDDMYE
ncbi:MAG: creatininase family protein [Bacteroidota bacterium]